MNKNLIGYTENKRSDELNQQDTSTYLSLNDIKLTIDSVLQEALNAVYKDRMNQYGNPEDNFKIIASFWTTYLKSNCIIKDTEISEEDVAMMMVLLKIARETNQHKRVNLVDIAGYVECADRIHNRE